MAKESWRAPAMWEGGTAWILGGGASILRQFDVPPDVSMGVIEGKDPAALSPYLAPLHDRHVIGVNNAYQIGSWLDALFFGDHAWYLFHWVALAHWPSLKVTCNDRAVDNRRQPWYEGVKYLAKDRSRHYGISPDPTKVSWNGNSGAAAINLAAHFGAKRIILLGFDMVLVDGVSHWHGCHRHSPFHHPLLTKKKYQRGPGFQRHLNSFPQIAANAKERGIEIINASPDSVITEFPKASVKELLSESSHTGEAEQPACGG